MALKFTRGVGPRPLDERAVVRREAVCLGVRVLTFDNTYARELIGFHAPTAPTPAPAPKLVWFNHALAAELGADADDALAQRWSGNTLPPGAEPIAQAYAGHQFGGFSPQLGDGRALVVGEVIDARGHRRDIALKGSGRTPFSRGGDGKAALGPMLRELIVGEGMHALGIPTSRALAVVATGERVMRDRPLQGAVLTRVAASHLRVGTFQYFAARGDTAKVRALADYTIARHYPDLSGDDARYLRLIEQVGRRQASLIASWLHVGFVHGVMNTDNVALSGETIDFGPCAFIDAFDQDAVFSSIDHNGRYAYSNQPTIGGWNLARFAETLLPLVHADEDHAVAMATELIGAFPGWFDEAWQEGASRKLGLLTTEAGDADLARAFLRLMEEAGADHTQTWRALASAAAGDEAALRAQLSDPRLDAWLAAWRARLGEVGDPAAARLRDANPLYIPRNHLVEAALAAAEAGDLEPTARLLEALSSPFVERPGMEAYAQPAPAAFTRGFRTFCGT